MPSFFLRYPIAGPLFAYALGIVWAVKFLNGPRAGLGLGLALASLLSLSLWASFKRPWLSLLALLGFCLCLGAFRMGQTLPRPLPQTVAVAIQNRQPVPLLVEALEPCRSRLGFKNKAKQIFTGKAVAYFVEGQPVTWGSKILFQVEAERCPVKPGQFFRTLAKLKRPRAFQNPSGFDYPRFLSVQGVSLLAYIKGPEWILTQPHRSSWRSRLKSFWQQSLQAGLQGFEHPGLLGFWEALLLKEKRFLSSDLSEGFRRLGLSHLLVVSGLHLSLFFGFCFVPCYFLARVSKRLSAGGGSKIIAVLLALGFTGLYASVLGFSASLGRAWWMSVAILWVLLSYRRLSGLSLLMLVALLLLLWDPGQLYQLSFQLSFAAVLALVLFTRRFQAWKQQRQAELNPPTSIVRWFIAALGSTLAVQLMLWPWSASVFRQFSWVAPLTNLVFVPWFSTVLLPLGAFGLVLSLWWPSAAEVVFWFVGFLSEKTLIILEYLSSLPVSFLLPRPMLFGWFLWGALLVSFFAPKVWPRKKIILTFVVFSFIFLFGELGALRPQTLRLSVLDVGQGESLLLEFPNGKNALVDGGGFPGSDFAIGEKVLLPELLHRRITHLDTVVLTHPDADHLVGLQFLLRHFSVGSFWLPKVFATHPQVKDLLAVCERRGIGVRFLQQGQRGHWGEVDWQVLWPLGPRLVEDEAKSDNNQSLVMRVCLQKVCFLLTGDIEATTEAKLVAANLPLATQFLKIAHHGSKTSSTEAFLQAVAPTHAAASLGRGHRFGFPHQEVVDRLKKLQVELYRTDQHGQIEVVTDGQGLEFNLTVPN